MEEIQQCWAYPGKHLHMFRLSTLLYFEGWIITYPCLAFMEVVDSPCNPGLQYVFADVILCLSGCACLCSLHWKTLISDTFLSFYKYMLACQSIYYLFRSVGCVYVFFIILLAPLSWFKVVSEVIWGGLLAFVFADLDRREKVPASFTNVGLTFFISLHKCIRIHSPSKRSTHKTRTEVTNK